LQSKYLRTNGCKDNLQNKEFLKTLFYFKNHSSLDFLKPVHRVRTSLRRVDKAQMLSSEMCRYSFSIEKKETYNCLGYIRSPYVPRGRRGFGKKSPKKTLDLLKNKKNYKSLYGKLMPKLNNVKNNPNYKRHNFKFWKKNLSIHATANNKKIIYTKI
jgi:hypothetical protein